MTNLFNKQILIIQDRKGTSRQFNVVTVDGACVFGALAKDDKDTVYSEKERKTVYFKKEVDVAIGDYVSFEPIEEDIEDALDFANAKKLHNGFVVKEIQIFRNGMSVDHMEIR